ncbi:enoyl-CoA hydratase/isomerase family protein [Radicibacter daui]|uniref:enoyl-CoA hydratase/isomerase family protein n=1 Tax=Radicibacter daui TaxID=3064829 RepID=UPI004046C9F1
MSDSKPVLIERLGAVTEIVLNRPARLNALDQTMLAGLQAAVAEITADNAVRAVVLRGAGDAFMAGGDIASFAAALNLPAEERDERFTGFLKAAQDFALAFARLPVPVVAALHGAVAGFGVSLMAGADLALAAEGTVLTTAYRQIGLTPDGGMSWLLPRLVGHRRAMELLLLADRFDAATALSIGLVNRVVPADRLVDEAHGLAMRIAAGPAGAQRRLKALMAQSAENGLAAQLDAEAGSFVALAGEADFAEGVAAFLAKRKPVFG